MRLSKTNPKPVVIGNYPVSNLLFNCSKVKTLRLVAQLKFICFGMDFIDRQIDLCSKQIDPNIHITLAFKL